MAPFPRRSRALAPGLAVLVSFGRSFLGPWKALPPRSPSSPPRDAPEARSLRSLRSPKSPKSPRPLTMASFMAMPMAYIAGSKALPELCRSQRYVTCRSMAAPGGFHLGAPEDGGAAMAMLALGAWLTVMYAIQHSLVSVPFLAGSQCEYFPIVATFIAGYAVIVLEEQTGITKAATALVLGVLLWALVGTGVALENFNVAVEGTLEDVAEVVFFLLGALSIVEIMDAHKGFDIITKAIQAKTQKELMVVIGVLTFLLSSVLNNLTVVIVMVSLLQKLVKDDDFRMKLGGLVVVASNAGGAWTPIGDITTTMLYISGQVTTVPLLANLFLPSSLCLVGAVGYEYLQMADEPFSDTAESKTEEVPEGQALVFWGGLFGMISVPIFTALTHCPAWSGMMLVLGLLGMISSLLHGPEHKRFSLRAALARVEVSDALFFLGVLFAVGALEKVGLLKDFAFQLNSWLGGAEALVAIMLGFASAVVDNVPLVAAAQGMYDLNDHPANDGLWNLITYCAATGGSLLVIGSAAGVAFMGLERKVSFGWYLKSVAPAALCGYFLGVGGLLAQQLLGLSIA